MFYFFLKNKQAYSEACGSLNSTIKKQVNSTTSRYSKNSFELADEAGGGMKNNLTFAGPELILASNPQNQHRLEEWFFASISALNPQLQVQETPFTQQPSYIISSLSLHAGNHCQQ
uniref:Uncharacterized protein n=1 Tax=Ditylenchus dipsaci TaxID=166011 RepID=A0A915CLC8_9BILA